MKKQIFSAVFLCGLLYTPALSEGLRDLCAVVRCGSGTECRVVIRDGIPGAACVPDDQIQLLTSGNQACYDDRLLINVPAADGESYSVHTCGAEGCPDGSVCANSLPGKAPCCIGEKTTPGACPVLKEGAIGVCGGVGLGCIADTECPTNMKCCSSACGSTLCTTPDMCDGKCTENEECVEKQVQCVMAPCDPVYECEPKPDNCGGCPKNKVCKEKEVECVSAPCDPVYECENRCGGCKDDEICVNDSPMNCRSPDCESFVCKPDKCDAKCTGASVCSLRRSNTCKECSAILGDGEKCAFRGTWCVGFSRNWCLSARPTPVDADTDVVCSKECREDERCILFPINCWFWRCKVEPRCVKLVFF